MVGRTPLPPGGSEMIMVDHAVAEQCLVTFKSVMEKKEGAMLDKAFIGDQLHAHYGLWDHAQAFKKFASNELQPVLDEGAPVIQKHIATLESLMMQLDKAQG